MLRVYIARVSYTMTEDLLRMSRFYGKRERHIEDVYLSQLLFVGAPEDARPLLRELKARSRLPIVSDAAQLRGDAVFDLECRATDLRALLCDEPSERRAGQEFTRKFVRI